MNELIDATYVPEKIKSDMRKQGTYYKDQYLKHNRVAGELTLNGVFTGTMPNDSVPAINKFN